MLLTLLCEGINLSKKGSFFNFFKEYRQQCDRLYALSSPDVSDPAVGCLIIEVYTIYIFYINIIFNKILKLISIFK